MTEESEQIVSLGSLLTADRIFLLHGKQEKNDVLDLLIDSLAALPQIDGRDDLAWGIFHRESLMSTGIGNGIAVPHFRLPELESPLLALAVCRDGVQDYHSSDGAPVRLVFLIVAGHKTAHVKILGRISKLFFDGRLKAAFLAANDAATCLEILNRAES